MGRLLPSLLFWSWVLFLAPFYMFLLTWRFPFSFGLGFYFQHHFTCFYWHGDFTYVLISFYVYVFLSWTSFLASCGFILRFLSDTGSVLLGDAPCPELCSRKEC
jgi:hypothetical protein